MKIIGKLHAEPPDLDAFFSKDRWSQLMAFLALKILARSSQRAGGLRSSLSGVKTAIALLPPFYRFLVACTRLYKTLCRSVGRSAGRSVDWSVGYDFF